MLQETTQTQEPVETSPSLSVATWLDSHEQGVVITPGRSANVIQTLVTVCLFTVSALFVARRGHPDQLYYVQMVAAVFICLSSILRSRKGGASDPFKGFPRSPNTERVRMEVIQDGVITGVDWGYAWIEKGTVYFTGRLTSFALPKTMIARRASVFKWREGPETKIPVTFCYLLHFTSRRVEVRFGLSDASYSVKHAFDEAVTKPERFTHIDEDRQLPPLAVLRSIGTPRSGDLARSASFCLLLYSYWQRLSPD